MTYNYDKNNFMRIFKLKIITYIIIASFLYGNCVYALPALTDTLSAESPFMNPNFANKITDLARQLDQDQISPEEAVRIIDEYLDRLSGIQMTGNPALTSYRGQLMRLLARAEQKVKSGMGSPKAIINTLRKCFNKKYAHGGTKKEEYENIIVPVIEEYGLFLGLKMLVIAGAINKEDAVMIYKKVFENEKDQKLLMLYIRGFRWIPVLTALLSHLFFSVSIAAIITIIVTTYFSIFFVSAHENSENKTGAIVVSALIILFFGVFIYYSVLPILSIPSTPFLIHSLWNSFVPDKYKAIYWQSVLGDYFSENYTKDEGVIEDKDRIEEQKVESREERPSVYGTAVRVYRKYIVSRLAQIIEVPQIAENRGLKKKLTRIIKAMQEDRRIEISDVMANRLLWLLDRSRDLNIVLEIAEIINLILDPDYADNAGEIVMAVEIILLEEVDNSKSRRLWELREGKRKGSAGVVVNKGSSSKRVDLLEKSTEQMEEGGGLNSEQLREYAGKRETCASELVDYIIKTGISYQIRVIADVLSSNPPKLELFIEGLSRKIGVGELILKIVDCAAMIELSERLGISWRWWAVINYLIKNKSVRIIVLSIIFDIERREDKEKFILKEADRIVQEFNEDVINQEKFKDILVISIEKFLEIKTSGEYDIQQLLMKHLGLAYQFAQVTAIADLEESFYKKFRNGYILLRAMEIVSRHKNEEVYDEDDEEIGWRKAIIRRCRQTAAQHWRNLRRLLRIKADEGDIEFTGPEREGSTVIREVRYKDEIYMAKYVLDDMREFEEVLIVSQYRNLVRLNKLGIKGVCRARHLIRLTDGRKAILFEKFPQGQTLYERKAAMSEGEAVSTILKVAEIVRELHKRAGLFHTDIKPDNIWLANDGEVTLFDFDYAERRNKKMDAEDLQISISRDIYMLGITLFYLVSGSALLSYDDPNSAIAKLEEGLFKEIVSRAAKDGDNDYQTIDEFIVDLKRFSLSAFPRVTNSSFSFPYCETDSNGIMGDEYIDESIKIGEIFLDSYSKISEPLGKQIILWLTELHNRSYCLDEFLGLEIQIVSGRFNYSVWRQGDTIFMGEELIRIFANVSKIPECRDFGLIMLYMMLAHERMHDGRLDGTAVAQFYEELLAVKEELNTVRDNYRTRYIFNMDSQIVLKILQNGWNTITRWIPDFEKRTNVWSFNDLLFSNKITVFDIAKAIVLTDGRFRKLRNKILSICEKKEFVSQRNGTESLKDVIGYMAYIERFTSELKEQDEEEVKEAIEKAESSIFQLNHYMFIGIPDSLREKIRYSQDPNRWLILANEETGKRLFIQVITSEKKVTGVFIGDSPASGIEYKTKMFPKRRGGYITRNGRKMGRFTRDRKGRYILNLKHIKGNIFVDRFLKREHEFVVELFLSLLKNIQSNAGRRTIIGFDTNIGNMDKFKAEELLLQIKDVSALLGDVEFVYSSGETLAKSIENKEEELMRNRGYKEEDVEVILITRQGTKRFRKGYMVLKVDDSGTINVPILELATFALAIKDAKDSSIYDENLKELYYILTGNNFTEEILKKILAGQFIVPLTETRRMTEDSYTEITELLKSA